MTFKDVWGKITNMRSHFDSGFSDLEKKDIKYLYAYILKKEIADSDCNNCYRDALIELYCFLKNKNKLPEKCFYKLKNGALIQPFGKGEFYTNVNLTNEISERYLKQFPERINLFESFPKDWVTRVKRRKL
nr:MAG TPA: hypothetical protein [Caudoviricetes sp.]